MKHPMDEGQQRRPSVVSGVSTGLTDAHQCTEQRYQDLFMNAYVGLYRICAESGLVLDCNDLFARWLGFPKRLLCLAENVSIDQILGPLTRKHLVSQLEKEVSVAKHEVELVQQDGSSTWLSFSASFQDGYMEGAVVDISETKRVQVGLEGQIRERTSSLHESRQLLQLVMDNVPQAIFWKNCDLEYMGCNRSFAKDAGFNDPEQLVGKTDYDLPWRKEEADWYRKCDRRVIESGASQHRILETQQQADGTEAWVETNKIPLHDEGGKVMGMLGTYEDITQFKRQQEELRQLSDYDMLTGLANRKLFKERLAYALDSSRKNGIHALLLIDLDHFKTLNDSLGHHFGDHMLVALGQRLREYIPLEHLVARLGGDEFAILLENVEGRTQAETIADSLMQEIRIPSWINGHEIVMTASLGLALFPDHGLAAKDLLRNAETAMYYAKGQGRNSSHFFTKDLDRGAMQRMVLENQLRKAIENAEFVVFYQPKIAIGSGQLKGVEALVRWVCPDKGLVQPEFFIGIAEEIGLIIQLSEIVLRMACLDARTWLDSGLSFGRIAVNLSPHQFRQDDMIERLEAILVETGLPTEYLELEITESAIVADTDRATAMMRRLRALGIHLALDDFGTGYSSLSSLKHFPLDTLKIDRSFIADIVSSPKDRNIAASVIGLGHYLGLNVVAEGVEDREQVSVLKDLRCEEMQGFYFSEPLPEKAMARLLGEMLKSSGTV